MHQPGQESEEHSPRVFATTHWSVVLAAGKDESAPAQNALESLCRAYWNPIYVYVCRKGHGPDDAQDLTQEFFAQLIEKGHLSRADRAKGKFRTFLLVTLDYFLANEWRHAHRQKRGGKMSFVSLDGPGREEELFPEPADNDTPESMFIRQWALTVLRRTMLALEQDCQESGKAELFRESRHILSGEQEGATYTEIARRLGMAEGTIRVAMHRLRQRYGELLRREIAHTVCGVEEVEEELRYLKKVLSE